VSLQVFNLERSRWCPISPPIGGSRMVSMSAARSSSRWGWGVPVDCSRGSARAGWFAGGPRRGEVGGGEGLRGRWGRLL